MDEETYLRKKLIDLQRSYQKEAEPYIKRLSAILSLKPIPPMIVNIDAMPEDVREQLMKQAGVIKEDDHGT